MGLQQNLQNIQTNLLQAKTAIAQSISNKGVECSADDKLSTFAEKIDSITTGSTGGTGEKFVVPNGLKFGYSKVFDPTMFDVSQVTMMNSMFYNGSGLKSLDLSTWNTSQVTTMYNMFNSCSGLTSLNVKDLDVSKVTTMYGIFQACNSLTSLDISQWNTAELTNISYMIQSCSKLTELDLSGWKTEKIKTAIYAFSRNNIITLDLSGWKLDSLTDTNNMFFYADSLTNLFLPDLGHNENCKELNLSDCSELSKDSILFLFNNAFDRSAAGYSKAFTITLNPTTKALLTEEEIAIATNKGFTVV